VCEISATLRLAEMLAKELPKVKSQTSWVACKLSSFGKYICLYNKKRKRERESKREKAREKSRQKRFERKKTSARACVTRRDTM